MSALLDRFFRCGRRKASLEPGRVALKRISGPSGAFSVAVPADWILTQGSGFLVVAPNGGPTLTAAAHRLDHCPPIAEFAEARYAGVTALRLYRQVGDQRSLPDGGVLREFVGTWPAESHLTSYAVACVRNASLYVTLALTTTADDYAMNLEFYRGLIAMVEVAGAVSAAPTLGHINGTPVPVLR